MTRDPTPSYTPPDSETPAAPDPETLTFQGRPVPTVPRNPASGGLSGSLSYDDVLTLYGHRKDRDWSPAPGRYYASGLGRCFLASWAKERVGAIKRHNTGRQALRDAVDLLGTHLSAEARTAALEGVGSDEPLPDWYKESWFDVGDSEAGHMVEAQMTKHLRSVYGWEGAVIQDVRITFPLQPGDDEVVYEVAKSDPVVLGDNLVVLNLFEVKSTKYWKKGWDDLVAQVGSRTIPLFLARVDEPLEEGFCNLNHLLQLAVEARNLGRAGRYPGRVSLYYVDRCHLGNHVEVVLTRTDVEVLAEFADWWILQHHEHLKSDVPPDPAWFMAWEAKKQYSSYQEYGALIEALLKERGLGKYESHPAVRGLNARLRDAHALASKAPILAKQSIPAEVRA